MKKVMIIVPHEDDEVNLTGGILNSSIFNKNNCYVVFMTNGDCGFKCKTRIKEAKKSTRHLKIPLQNVIFLGDPDQCFDGNNHIYHTRDGEIFESASKHKETYCESGTDFHYQQFGKHANYNYDSLIKDITLLIKTIKPDIFFVNDFDSHPDHRCCSLCFEKSLGMVLKEDRNYAPKVYKGFAYPTAYKSVKDFNNLNLESAKFNTEDYSFCEMENPYYKWEDRIRFPTGKESRNRLLIFNKCYKNIKKHRSQIPLLKNFASIINSDQVFWERKTNNLAFCSNVITSSGNGNYLNDFLLFDCESVLNGNKIKPKLLDVAWVPDEEDKEKKVKFEFFSQQEVSSIRLYQNVNSKKLIKNIEISFSDNTSEKYKLENDLITKINIKKENIEWIEVKILDNIKNSGFSEIEILKEEVEDFKYIKILDSNDNFIYNSYIYDNLNINIYEYDGINSRYLSKSDYDVYQDGRRVENYNLNINRKKCKLKVSLKENPNIYDIVILEKLTTGKKFKHGMIVFLNNILFNFDLFLVRVINRIKRCIYKGVI